MTKELQLDTSTLDPTSFSNLLDFVSTDANIPVYTVVETCTQAHSIRNFFGQAKNSGSECDKNIFRAENFIVQGFIFLFITFLICV